MEALWKVLDRLPFSLLLAAALAALLAWLFKTYSGWDSYRPLFQSRAYIVITVFLTFNALAFELTRFLISNVGSRPAPLFFITDHFQPAGNRGESSALLPRKEPHELILSFRLINTSSAESYELLRLDVESLGMLFRREAILMFDTGTQFERAASRKEDLGALIFSLYSSHIPSSWLRLTSQLSFIPPTGALRYPIPTDRDLPILPIEQRLEILPGRALAMQIQVRSARTVSPSHVISVGSEYLLCTAPKGYKVSGFDTKPEYPFRILVEAVSSRGERLRFHSDHIYSIAPHTGLGSLAAVLRSDEGKKDTAFIDKNVLTHESANAVDTLPITSWFSGSHEMFLYHVIHQYVVLMDECEQFRSTGCNEVRLGSSGQNVVRDLCVSDEQSPQSVSADRISPSNVVEFVREFQKKYADTASLITRLSSDPTLSERDRLKATWISGELRK